MYLRLLNRSVDSVGGGLGGALSQQRLLIPVILTLGYNRCAALRGRTGRRVAAHWGNLLAGWQLARTRQAACSAQEAEPLASRC